MKGQWITSPNADISVVFVHGILSEGNSCWTNQNGCYWPKLLSVESNIGPLGIYVFTYNTGFFSGSYSVNDIVDALKEHMRLDGVSKSRRLVFVCHSMGGIVARKLVVERAAELIREQKVIGLFLVASPSLGASYADWLSPLARLLGHSQADALRFVRNNVWLSGLDKEFKNLKESGHLRIIGKEIVEDRFVVLNKLFRRQVVEPFVGAVYFGESFKVPKSDHFSIAKPADEDAIQHRLLCDFIRTVKSCGVHLIERSEPASDSPLLPLSPYCTVPPLPAAFVPRTDVFESLVQKLLSTSRTIGVTPIAGMAGVGKTTIVKALCHDERVRARFSDGIVWLTIGNEAVVSKQDLFRRVADALNQRLNAYSEEAYRSLLADKSTLVVLDDVWSRDVVEPLMVPSGWSRLLYTSRDKGLAGPLSAENHEIDVLDETQSRTLLAAWSGLEQKRLPEPFASEILKHCDGLPLALGMIGGGLKGKPPESWQYVLDDLETAKLRQIGIRPIGYGHETLYAAIAVSIESLEPTKKARYLQLAIALEDMSLGKSFLQALWGGAERELNDFICLLVNLSLASRDASGNILLHDLQLDYIRCQHPDPIALQLQHRALERSLHIVYAHPEQFASQMAGRLLAHRNQPSIAVFLNDLERNVPMPRLRPLLPALEPVDSVRYRFLSGHTKPITALVLSSDAKVAVSGSEDGSLLVWNLQGTGLPRALHGHAGWIEALAFLSSGESVVSASRDGTIRIWDLQSKESLAVQQCPGNSRALFSSDGKLAALWSIEGNVLVWSLQGEQSPRILQGQSGLIALALSRNCRILFSGSATGIVQVWDLQREESLPTLESGGLPWVTVVALSSDGKFALSGLEHGGLLFWDLHDKAPARVLEGHTRTVTAVALSGDGKLALSGSEDGTVRVWDVEGKKPPRILEHHRGATALAISNDNKLAISGSVDGTLLVWDLQGKDPTYPQITSLALSNGGELTVSGCPDGTLMVRNVWGNQPPLILEGSKSPVTAVAISNDGKLILSGSKDASIRLWDVESKQPPSLLRAPLERILAPVTAVALSGDGALGVSICQFGSVEVWDLRGKKLQDAFSSEVWFVADLALSNDGKLAVCGGGDEYHGGAISIRDLKSSQPARVLEVDVEFVTAVALSSDGRLVISGSNNGSVFFWDLHDNESPRVLGTHTRTVTAVAISKDDNLAVSGSGDGTLTVWDLRQMKELGVFTCDFSVSACTWQGRNILAGDQGGRFHVLAWDV